jgi:hypothetical protein
MKFIGFYISKDSGYIYGPLLCIKNDKIKIKCMYCSNNANVKRYYFMWHYNCYNCLFKKFDKIEYTPDYIIKTYFSYILTLKHCIDLPDIIRFYIGKCVKERNRKHKFERKCYHFHKATCKTIYAFCLFAKRYYPLELNRDIRLKICKFILE